MSSMEAPAKAPEPIQAKAPAPALRKPGSPDGAATRGAQGRGSPTGRKTAKEGAQAKRDGSDKRSGAGASKATPKGQGGDTGAASGLSAAEQKRLAAVKERADHTETAQTTHTSAQDGAAQARAAAAEPVSQAQGEALDAHAGVLEKNAPPDPEIVAKIAKIKQAIRDKRPDDEDELGKADPDAMARSAGQELSGDVKSEVAAVDQGYGPIHDKPQGTPNKPVTPLPGEAEAPVTAALAATDAAPDPLTTKEVSVDADKKDVAKDAKQAKLDRPEMAEVKDGPIPEAIAAKAELDDFSIWGPNEVLKSDKELRASATASMKVAEAEALKEMKAARKAQLAAAEGDKGAHKSGDEKKRDDVGKELQKLYDDAEDSVRAKLKPMVGKAMSMWDEGLKPLSTNFDRALKRVDKWIKDRQDSTLSSIRDFFAGLPNWIIDEYEKAEKDFADGAGDLALTISSWVNGIIRDCQKIIADAKTEMKTKIDRLEPSLQEYALGEQARLEKRFDALAGEVSSTKRNFTKQLTQKLGGAVSEKRKKVADLREKSKGLWQRAKEAVAAFIDDPLKALINGLLSLLGIPPASFWAMVAKFQAVIEDIKDKPKVFANNLVAAIQKGFEQFKDNIETHLIKGLLTWLTSKLKDAGVEPPADLSIKSLLTFFLQILGISWPKIRQKLVKYIGEKNMKRVELAIQLVTTFMREGWEGLYKLVKDRLDPQTLINAVLNAVKTYIIETIVKQAALRIIALFNPVGAIVQAIELIYKAVTWIIDNAAKIFTFIEAIVNGAANIMAGAISGAANLIEKALALLVPVVIDLFAKLLSLGNLPDKVKDVVGGLQATVDGAIDRVIEWIASKVGLEDETKKEPDGDEARGVVGAVYNLSVEDEQHSIWIELDGDRATVKMASGKGKPIEGELEQIHKTAQQVKLDPEQLAAVDARLAEAAQLQDEVERDVEKKAKQQLQAGDQAPASAESDAKVSKIGAKVEEAIRLENADAAGRFEDFRNRGPFPVVSFAPPDTKPIFGTVESPENDDQKYHRSSAKHFRQSDYGKHLEAQKVLPHRNTLSRDIAKALKGAHVSEVNTAGGGVYGFTEAPPAYQALIFEFATVPAAQLPEKVRLEVVRMIQAASVMMSPATYTPSVSTITVTIDKSAVAAVENYLALEKDAPDATGKGKKYPGLEEAFDRWSKLFKQPEWHHAWPQWLLGNEVQSPQLFLPRALHNLAGDGNVGEVAFHQHLAEAWRADKLRDEYGFSHEASASSVRLAYDSWDRPRQLQYLQDVRATLVKVYVTTLRNVQGVGLEVYFRTLLTDQLNDILRRPVKK